MNYDIEYEYQGKKYKIKVDESFVELPYDEQNARLQSSIMAQLSQQGTDKAGNFVEEFISAAVSPFRDTIKLSGEAAQWGQDLMSESVDNMKSGRAPLAPLDFLMGLTGWVVSPLTGFFQSFLGEPTEALTEAGLNELADLTGTGDSEAVRAANKRAAELTGQTVAIAPEVLGPAGIARGAASILKAEQGTASVLRGPLRYLAGEKAPVTTYAPLVGDVSEAEVSSTSRLVKEGLEEAKIPVDLTTPGVVQRMSLKNRR